MRIGVVGMKCFSFGIYIVEMFWKELGFEMLKKMRNILVFLYFMG